MYINRNTIIEAANHLVNHHGTIRRIYSDNDSKPIGYVIRKEMNITPDTAEVLFNISFNNLYGRKYFTPSEYKYFALQHTNKVRDLEKDVDAEIELFGDHNEKNLEKYLSKYLVDVADHTSQGFGQSHAALLAKLKHEVLKSVRYYEGRKVRAYFVINV